MASNSNRRSNSSASRSGSGRSRSPKGSAGPSRKGSTPRGRSAQGSPSRGRNLQGSSPRGAQRRSAPSRTSGGKRVQSVRSSHPSGQRRGPGKVESLDEARSRRRAAAEGRSFTRNDGRGRASARPTSSLPVADGSGRGRFPHLFGRKADSQQQGTTVRQLQRARNERRIADRLQPLMRIVAIVACIAVILLVGMFVLRHSPLFPINEVTISGNTYLSEDEVLSTADIKEGATLFNCSTSDMVERLEADPWIASAKVKRVFPGRLNITVTESSLDYVVEVPVTTNYSSLSRWAMSENGLWLSIIDENTSSTQTVITADTTLQAMPTPSVSPTAEAYEDEVEDEDARVTPGVTLPITPMVTPDALQAASGHVDQQALSANILANMGDKPKITNVSTTIRPVTGEVCDDKGILTGIAIMKDLSDGFGSRVTSISAPDPESVTLTLDNGVEVSFGSSEDVRTKERVAMKVLSEHEGSVTYINVRVPDSPAWRGL